MGNKLNSNVSDAVKEQAAGQTPIYQFINVKGGGELVELMKRASRTKNYREVDERIREGLKQYLYNEGKGKFIPIDEIVQARSGKIADVEKRKNEISVTNLEAVTDSDSDMSRKNGCQRKEVCWRLDQRGSVGETPLHVCLLSATAIHADLAKRLLRIYPKLIADVYILDVYYGENVLHMAIVNEDPAMVKFLLDNGADYHQRCCGNFFLPDDQKASRANNDEHEWFDLPIKTNYDGYTYWGEYPLCFAVCLGQEECVRLLVAKGADPNTQDSNGNTALHMIVINDQKMRDRSSRGKDYSSPEETFDLLVQLGAKLNLKNRQGLTPLTLAAKLAREEMYEHILKIDREMYWIYGNVACAGYPLEHIDSIAPDTGKINTNSVLYHVIYGEKREHMEMIDGTVSQLLHEKWKTFAKYRFFRRFFLFIVYFAVLMVAFALRPGTPKTDSVPTTTTTTTTTTPATATAATTAATAQPPPEQRNLTETVDQEQNSQMIDKCYLLRPDSTVDEVRLAFELLTVIGSVIYIVLSLREFFHQGRVIFVQTLAAAPAKTLFLISNFIVLFMIPGRAACAPGYEDVMAVFALLSCGPYFLFFCRGFKIVGPFVVMIYKMLRTDLLRFFSIYLIFVVGFSQAMFVMFRGYQNAVFDSVAESMLGMFRMSIGAFADVYSTFENNVTEELGKTFPVEETVHTYTVRIIFVIYMILVTLLLVNMLIAMMGHTYDSVNESPNEWHRQWAKVILVVEQAVTPDARKRQQLKYSQPMKDGRRALAIRWHLTEREQNDLEEMRKEQKLKSQIHAEKDKKRN